MVRKALVTAILCLAGCNPPVSRSEAEEIAQAHSAPDGYSRARIAELEQEVAALKSKQDATERHLDTVEEAQSKLLQTFNHNVRVDNDNAVRAMTRRGACGKETIVDEYGSTIIRNKECTLKDLR